MNPLACASLTLLLAVSQAVGVAAKGKSKSKSKGGKAIPLALIIGVVAAVVVLAVIVVIFLLIRKRSLQAKKMNAPVQPQQVVYNNGGYDNGGYPPGPEKDGYPPYSLNGTPLLNSPASAGWGQNTPPPQFTPVPNFPAPHVPSHA